MSVKVGDRVRFLNDIGGGIVTAFKNANTVLVDGDDGFEVPALVRECVIIETRQEQVNKQTSNSSASFADVKEETYIPLVEESPEGEVLNVVLAVVPTDPGQPTESDLEVYLINDSNYFCYYTLNAFRGEGYYCESHDLLEPNTKVYLETVERSRLMWLTKSYIQLIAFKQGKSFTKQTIYEKNIEITAAKLAKPGVYQKNDFFDNPVYMLKLTPDLLEEKLQELSASDFATIKKEKAQTDTKPLAKKRERVPILEVDLHINQLLDDLTGLSNADILNHQMAKFRETIEENKALKGQKIVFIHGIGNGTLKTELRKELDRTKLNYQDASFKEYGFGATMITIR